ncbi:MAG: hypothetical protein Q8914_01305 [Bacteroidota bacterium]|nr:hypothetical protein [Bacteroidota bacterium]
MKKTGKTVYPDLEKFPCCPYCGETCPEFDLSTMTLNGECTKCQFYNSGVKTQDYKLTQLDRIKTMFVQ